MWQNKELLHVKRKICHNKRIYKKHPISFAMIVGVLSSLITIYQFWISPEDKVRNKIESHVCVIRDTFNCEDINEKARLIKILN